MQIKTHNWVAIELDDKLKFPFYNKNASVVFVNKTIILKIMKNQ